MRYLQLCGGTDLPGTNFSVCLQQTIFHQKRNFLVDILSTPNQVRNLDNTGSRSSVTTNIWNASIHLELTLQSIRRTLQSGSRAEDLESSKRRCCSHKIVQCVVNIVCYLFCVDAEIFHMKTSCQCLAKTKTLMTGLFVRLLTSVSI